MEQIIEKTDKWLNKNKDTLTIEQINYKKDEIIKIYNNYTNPYRNLMSRIDNIIEKKKQAKIKNCVHEYVRESGFCNEYYFICNKCGHEA